MISAFQVSVDGKILLIKFGFGKQGAFCFMKVSYTVIQFPVLSQRLSAENSAC